jgi:hypothetical protein
MRRNERKNTSPRRRQRRGQSLVEFALVAIVSYMLLAGILTFGYLFYAAYAVQQAADVGAREIARTPLAANATLEDYLPGGAPTLIEEFSHIYSEDFLVIDLDTAPEHLLDAVAGWPILNQQLYPLMIVDRPDLDGDGEPDANLLRYPGALLTSATTPTGFTVGIPLVVTRDADGVETIRWLPVVEEIDSDDMDSDRQNPFSIAEGGIVALRINYPFQSASMSSFRQDPSDPFAPTLGSPNVADDAGVVEENAAPGGLTGAPLEGGGRYAGTYGGQYGLGAQGALGSPAMTGGRPVRPFRKVISAQAVYRREVFGPPIASP